MRCALFLIAIVAAAETPPDVLDFFRTAAEALSQSHPSEFLGKFDRKMPGYDQLRYEIEGLRDVGSTIEVVSDEGDDHRRSLELDWLLEVADQKPRRMIVKCRIEREGKKWMITALDPVEFFKY